MTGEQKRLFLVEVRDEEGNVKTYRIVRALNVWGAEDLVYYSLTDEGIHCTRYDMRVYACLGEEFDGD